MTVSYTRAIEILEEARKKASPGLIDETGEAYAMAIRALRRERLNGIGGFPIPTDEVLEQWRKLREQEERREE